MKNKSVVLVFLLTLYIAPLISLATYDASAIPTQPNNTNFVLASEAWLTGWDYRQEIEITGSVGASTNYVINFTVSHNVNMENDFGDIRFTDNDKTTELEYYFEEVIPANYVDVWVKVTDNLDSNQLIYMYYGKTGASTTSNATAVFPFYDGFEIDDFGNWDTVGAVFSRNHDMIGGGGDWFAPRGEYSAFADSASSDRILAKTISVDYDCIFHSWLYLDDSVGSGANTYIFYPPQGYCVYSDANDVAFNNGSVYYYAENVLSIETWYEFEIAIDVSEQLATFYLDGVQKNSMVLSWSSITQIRVITDTSTNIDFYFDDYYVRKWVSIEPEATIQPTVENAPVVEWHTIGTGEFYVIIDVSPTYLWAVDVLLVFFGAGMIIFSTSYFAVKIKNKDVDTNACFYGSILFIFGWALLLGVVIG